MWFDRVRNLLEAVAVWLGNTEEEEIWWRLKTQVVELCFQEMTAILEARAPITNDPASDDLRRIAGSLRIMIEAMNRRDRTTALEAGRATLAVLEMAEPNLIRMTARSRSQRPMPARARLNTVPEVA